MGSWSERHRDHYFPSHYSVLYPFGANHTHDGVCTLGIQGNNFLLTVLIYYSLGFTLFRFQIYNRSSAIIPLLMLLALLQGMTGTALELSKHRICICTLFFSQECHLVS